MATVIDSLIVTLGLDPSNFTKGQKEAAEAIAKTRNESVTAAKEMEARGKQAGEFFNKVRAEAVKLFAVFTAGQGLRQFVAQTTASDAALGRMARVLGMSTNQLSAWQGAAERAGGSAEGVTGAIQGLSQQFQSFQLTGQSSIIPFLRTLGVQVADLETGQLRPLSDIMLDLSDVFQGMDPQRAQYFGQQLGFDQGTINLLSRGRRAVEDLLAEQRQLGTVNQEQATAAQELEKAWKDLVQTSRSLGREMLTEFTPAIIAAVKAFRELLQFFRDNPDAAKAFFGALTLAAVAWSATTIAAVARVTGAFRALSLLALPPWLMAFLGPAAGFALGMTPRSTQSQGQENAGLGRPEGAGPMGESPEMVQQQRDAARARNREQQQRYIWGPLRQLRDRVGSFFGVGGSASGSDRAILDLIGRAEGTDRGAGYNETLGYGAYSGGPQNLTGMSLAEIDQLQGRMLAHPGNRFNSSAVGRYQITRTTLRGLINELGLDPSSTRFDEATQDRLAMALLERRGLADFRAGRITRDQFQANLAREWASIPDPATGQGFYDGQRRPGVAQPLIDRTLGSVQDPALIRGSAGAALGRGASVSSTSSSETHIGAIHVYTQATDAQGIARDLGEQMRRYSFVPQANTGLA